MTTEKAFDTSIQRFIREQPNSSASQLIIKIVKCFPGSRSYYSILDSFSFSLGLGILAVEIIGGRKDKTLGYLPYIKYYPGNKLGEEPRQHQLISAASPLKLNQCYSYLAKELLYRLMRVDNIEELIEKKRQGVLTVMS